MNWLGDAVAGIEHGRRRRREIAENLRVIRDLEERAVRIIVGPAGRCFEMTDGRLLTIQNEQPTNSTVLHFMAIRPLTREDAEDFYGWGPA